MLSKFAESKALSKVIKRAFSNKLKIPLPIKDGTLAEQDPELFDIIEKEKYRQWAGIELIASENYTSTSVLECLGSVLTNKYSEGYPGKRYYGGNEFIDMVENLAISRTLKAFNLSDSDWGVAVQPLSGSPANFCAYTALVPPGGKIMGLSLYCGGHLTHGFQTETKKVSATSIYFTSQSYKTSEKTGRLDYDEMQKNVDDFKPKVLIVGGSAYPRDFDYARLRKIADSSEAYLLADISHISGLIAAGEQNSPFELCDIVTSTTHKSLRGPRSGIIMFNKKRDSSLEEKVLTSVFPMHQGGPHNHQIAAVATQMLQVATPEFREYIKQVKRNAKAMAEAMIKKGYTLISGGTDNHLMLWDVKPQGLTGSKIEKVFDMLHITVNKNTVIGDKSALTPGGVRIGTPAVTTRGMLEKDMETIVDFIDRGTQLCLKAQKKAGKKLNDFIKEVENDPETKKLNLEVQDFSKQFYIPGVDVKKMKYQ